MTKKSTSSNIKKVPVIQDIPLDSIKEPEIPVRKQIANKPLDDLIDSIRAIGLIEPIGLRQGGEKYEIIWGHRRFLAHKRLNRATIRAIILEMETDKMLISRAHENLFREGITPYEEACYFDMLQEKYGFTNKRLATVMGKSESYISQRLDILNWPEVLRTALLEGKITFSVGRILRQIQNPGDLKNYLMHAIKNKAAPSTVQKWVDLYFEYHVSEETEVEQREFMDKTVYNEPATTQCYFCRQQAEYSQAKNIWVHVECLKSIINEILERVKDGEVIPG